MVIVVMSAVVMWKYCRREGKRKKEGEKERTV